MKLWWVHNEASIAALYAFVLTNDKECFDWFTKEVTNDRRAADLGGDDLVMKGEQMKLMGNLN